MTPMRKSLLVVVSAMTVVVLGAGAAAEADSGAGAAAATGTGVIAPEADVAHHGRLSLWSGELSVRVASENHGPSAVADATVRLDFSVPLVRGQELPANCLWGGDRTVLCRTGQLRAVGRGGETAIALRTVGDPDEAVVQIDTVWNGGASDRNPDNNRHRVLVPATGDAYAY
ncbi:MULTISPECIES: hypothetical protein [unclassified Streptomyces]|uniref:hypothetical protein n=1 Tax=unclassified Streptomyces TaxID=2593676 RepID=UPI001F529301|nr:hypothetical protein [Streptomyces sp. NBC_00370]